MKKMILMLTLTTFLTISISIILKSTFASDSPKNRSDIKPKAKSQKLTKEDKNMNINVASNSFKSGDMIPPKFTCDGANISPQISWSNIPKSTMSLALISDDPDAPAGTWVHWVVYDIPASVMEFQESVSKDKILKNGAKQGMTDFRSIGYGGPCPPSGTHRYYFKVYALDKMLNIEPGLTKAQILKAMEGHILAQGELMGKYNRG